MGRLGSMFLTLMVGSEASTASHHLSCTFSRFTCTCSRGTSVHTHSSLLMSQMRSPSTAVTHSPDTSRYVIVRCFLWMSTRTSRPFAMCFGTWDSKQPSMAVSSVTCSQQCHWQSAVSLAVSSVTGSQ
ncbi:hypothetical protein NP493_35g03012 [Ridgeia piscesae]|uniref:Secreted protein n=1 Tax=Ridgeia piscesae TaxID=27915 RepID=A0AAD9PCX3_RIDPI|nr:hypothetical protein NP493_35g03012 [Ridgeia piscesae]